MGDIPMVKKHRHSPNQSPAAHTGSGTGSDHSLDAPVVCKVSSSVHDHVGQIKGPAVRNKRACVPPTTAMQRVAVLQPSMPGRTVNGQKMCILSLAAKAKQDGAFILDSDAAKWFSEDVRRVLLALDVLGLDGAVGDQLADLELPAVNVL
eukprot:3763313-Pleurochrysis_carterae.AAC.1